ncbi:MAG: GNAT family N-acetyltransferase [Phycisphaerales bacterium]
MATDGPGLLPPPSARLRFRRFEATDVPDILATFNNPEAQRFFGLLDEAKARDMIARQHARYERDGFGFWMLELRETGEHVGDCGFSMQEFDSSDPADGPGPFPEVGYHLRPEHRGKGYAAEAAGHTLAWAFEATAFDRIWSFVHNENAGSIRVAERIHTRRGPAGEKMETVIRSYFTLREDFASGMPTIRALADGSVPR